MTTLANTTQSPFVRALHKSGLLAQDLDYHIVPRLDGDHVPLLRLPEVVSV